MEQDDSHERAARSGVGTVLTAAFDVVAAVPETLDDFAAALAVGASVIFAWLGLTPRSARLVPIPIRADRASQPGWQRK